MAFGAGTVMRGSELTRAGDARAGFILSPHVDDDLITHSTPLGTPLLAGASTATECVRAVTPGAAGVKLFPASTGGRGYLAALRQPLGSRSFAPTGGITLETASAFIDAGAPAVTLGGTLTTLDGRDLTEAAQRVVAAAKVAQPLAGCGD